MHNYANCCDKFIKLQNFSKRIGGIYDDSKYDKYHEINKYAATYVSEYRYLYQEMECYLWMKYSIEYRCIDDIDGIYKSSVACGKLEIRLGFD